MKAHSRQQQKTVEICAASARAISRQPDLHFRGRQLYRGSTPQPSPAVHLREHDAERPYAASRGRADAIALRLRHSDPQLHQQHAPIAPIARLIFDLLEQCRIEAQAPAHLPGAGANINANFKHWASHYFHTGLAENYIGNLMLTLILIARARINAAPVPEYAEAAIEATRAAIVPVIGHALAELKACRHDQAAFARPARQLAETVCAMIEAELADQQESGDAEQSNNALAAFPLLLAMEEEGSETEAIATAKTGRSPTFSKHHQQYHIYTTEFDQEVAAASLIRPALLTELRAQLDQQIHQQGINVRELARKLAAALNPPQQRSWLFGQEEGRIDGRRLSQLVSSPTERRLFYQDHHQPTSDAVVSLLIDCSGSMREHIDQVAIIVDVMVKALGMAGITSEVLGFSTAAWNGGRAHQQWLSRGRPAQPGRLNETCHLIFKPAEQGWRQSRKSIAALLKADLFKEGVDGEAVAWACQRLRLRAEDQRYLLVISDGCPMDTATNLTNDPFYLDNHLKAVVAQETHRGEITILGLGVGLDLSPYYPRNLAMAGATAVDNRLMTEIVELFASSRGKNSGSRR